MIGLSELTFSNKALTDALSHTTGTPNIIEGRTTHL